MTFTHHPFKLAVGLWVTPDFKTATAGGKPPPRVNHSQVDFAALRDALIQAFPYGPPVEIMVPNDTVDQVTVHLRAGMVGGGTPDLEAAECRDFGRALLACVKHEKKSVIDVREAWRGMHAAPVLDRDFAPPPILLPFVVLANDFEDAMIWHANTRPTLGLPPFDVLAAAMGNEAPDGPGKMPSKLQANLRDVFGCPFESAPALLSRLASDRIPVGMEGLN